MNDAAWWARVVEARTERDDLRPKRVWTLRKDGREAAIDVKAVPGFTRDQALLDPHGFGSRRVQRSRLLHRAPHPIDRRTITVIATVTILPGPRLQA
jgi:hypothetical protein